MTAISISILIPLVAGLLLVAKNPGGAIGKKVALLTSLLVLLGGILGAVQARAGTPLSEIFSWLPAIGLQYHLSADGISSVFWLLTGVVFVMGVIASLPTADGRYFGFVLLLQSGLLGTFTAQNFLHFFLPRLHKSKS